MSSFQYYSLPRNTEHPPPPDNNSSPNTQAILYMGCFVLSGLVMFAFGGEVVKRGATEPRNLRNSQVRLVRGFPKCGNLIEKPLL